MDITREYILGQIETLEQGKAKLQADYHAHDGAIQAWRMALAKLDEPAPEDVPATNAKGTK